MAKTLFAVDELSGFIAACALVRPTGIEGMKPKSVKKKLKQPSFAAGVNRDEVQQGAEELGVDFDEHVAFVIAAMAERADELGLAPRDGEALEARLEDPHRPRSSRSSALLAINTLVVDSETKDAESRSTAGGSSSLPGGDVQVTDTGPPRSRRAGAPIVLIHCFGCSLHWWDSMVPLLAARSPRDPGRPARPRRLREAEVAATRSRTRARSSPRRSTGSASGRGGRRPLARRDVAVSVAEQASQLVDRVVIIDQAPDTSFGSLDFLAKLSMAPVIGRGAVAGQDRLAGRAGLRAGVRARLRPGRRLRRTRTRSLDDNEAMTYTSYTRLGPGGGGLRPTRARSITGMSDVGRAADGDLRRRGPDLRRRRGARRLLATCPACGRRRSRAPATRPNVENRSQTAAPDQRVRRRRGRRLDRAPAAKRGPPAPGRVARRTVGGQPLDRTAAVAALSAGGRRPG